MERLPYIDEHARSVDANRDRTWKALLKVVCKDPADPSTVPSGFALDAIDPPHRLSLAGAHRFSRYTLTFELDDRGPRHTVVRARTRAEFPGVGGAVYRALVIGSGGHELVVRRMLRRIAAAS
ncbi:hypothetical protein GV794_19910 [Nocardia cyriacigeorgica]|uniref:DUF2867 domain-containing protein n=1 Tax=Nocardia cyriacigeorgica TaxID=135487 RepID=A0ABX0CN89_9NOCA|nr:hypothetical protein [Nocardia cyriacigeorgica]